MEKDIRLLLIEDSEDDEKLTISELERFGFSISHKRVETGADMKKALAEETWDIIISDYKLPVFSGIEALEIFNGAGIDIPFIIVSGTIGEEKAVAAMKNGASDYVMKHNMARLGPAVERELKEATGRREKKQAEALINSQFKTLTALYSSSKSLTIDRDAIHLAEHIAKTAAETLSADFVWLARSEPDGRLLFLSAHGKLAELCSRTEIRWDCEDETAGVCCQAVKKGEPIIHNTLDHFTCPHPCNAVIRENNIKSIGAFPLISRGKTFGMMMLGSYVGSFFTEDRIAFFSSFVNNSAAALENARLFDETGKSLMKISTLMEIDKAIAGSLDIGLTLNVALDNAIEKLGADAACILTFNQQSLDLEYGSSRGFHWDGMKNLRVPAAKCLAGKSALEKKMIMIPDLGSIPDDIPKPVLKHIESMTRREGFSAYFAIPSVAKGKVMGVMELFFRQPFYPALWWQDFFRSMADHIAIAIENHSLFSDINRANFELRAAYDSSIEGWSRALDFRDKETEGHSVRVTEMTVELARMMGMSEEKIAQARRGALLHDMGKLGIPDAVLLKPGALNDEEWVIMKKHPFYALEMLAPIEFLGPALDIPYGHHEKWDGSGYPRGLKGEQIPISARIFAVADVWDALRSDRPYRKAWSVEKTHEYIVGLSGTHFDPKAVEAYVQLKNFPDFGLGPMRT